MDIMVLRTQEWLNDTYGDDPRYVAVAETGNTGWNTIYALRRALQIELGIQNTSSNFGPTTTALFNQRFPNGVQQQEHTDDTEDNIYSIIQGALWCKGYSTNASYITQHFYNGTGNGIRSMKTDAGMVNPSSTVTIEVMKALLSMRQFKLVYGGDSTIREIQQRLNREYPGYIDYDPCDGIYGREMCEDLIIALQAIEGFTVSEATGNFGNGTKSRLPIIPYVGNDYTTDEIAEAILLIRAALYCNGYTTVNVLLDTWDTTLEEIITNFQREMCLPETGTCDLNTWMSLLLSKGNPDRACIACDTRFEMTTERLDYLVNNGYQVVGRYLTGGDFKELREGEVQRILDAGLELFPIYQESGSDLSYFTYAQGKEDAKRAVTAARKHGIPGDNVIYFAVDTDPTDYEITNYTLPYFRGIAENITPAYDIGIYGTRNACTRVMNEGYAETCFVSDMSTGYSGNMGFPMPQNWNFDQFHEFEVTTNSGSWDLDKDAYSERYNAVDNLYKSIFDYNEDIETLEEYFVDYKISKSQTYNSRDIVLGVTNFLRSFKYDNIYFYTAFLEGANSEFINYVINRNYNLYSRLAEYANSDSVALIDNLGGLIDIGHLAATVEGYMKNMLIDSFWLGWGGDLASAMAQVDQQHSQTGEGYSVIANRLIGKRSSFGYADICTDGDEIKIAQIASNNNSNHPLSSAIDSYYSTDYYTRFLNYGNDIGIQGLFPTATEISNKMTSGLASLIAYQVLGQLPSDDAKSACCQAFADFIQEYYDFQSWFSSIIIA